MHIFYRPLFLAIFIAFTIISSTAFAQSTHAWSGGSGNWNDPSKWIPTGVPAAGDVAIINTGTATITEDTEIGTLNLTGGTVFGSGKLTISNLLSWTDGRFSGNDTGDTTIIAATATVEMNGDGNKDLNARTLIFRGDVTWDGLGKIRLFGGSAWINDTGNTFEIRNSSSVDFSSPGGGTFINYGTLNKTNSAAETAFEAIFENHGTLNVLVGSVKFTGGSDNSGAIFAAGGGTIRFSGDTHGFDNVTFSGLGAFENSDGVFQTTGGGLTVSAGTRLTMLGSNSRMEGDGPVTIDGIFDWGRSVITGSGAFMINDSLIISGNSSKRLDGRTIINNGVILWKDTGSLRLLNAAAIVNASSGIFEIRNNALLDFNDPNGGRIDNGGMLIKSAGSGISTFDVELRSSGTVEVDSGTVKLTRGSSFTGGVFSLNQGTTLEFDEGNHEFNENAILTVAGTLRVLDGVTNFNGTINGIGPMFIENGIFNFNSNSTFTDLTQTGGVLGGSGRITVNGNYIWKQGTITGSGGITVNQLLDMTGLDGDIKVLDGQSLTNAGTAFWSGPGDLRLANDAVFLNQTGAFFDIQTDANIDIDFGAVTGGSLHNAGTLTKRNSFGTSQFNVFFLNSGNTNINSGILRLLSGSSTDGGVFNIAATSTMEISSGEHTWQNAAFSGQGNIITDELQITVNGDPGLTIGPEVEMGFRGSTSIWEGDGTVTNNGTLNWDRGRIRGDGDFVNNNVLNIGGNNFKLLDGRTITNNGAMSWNGGGAFRMVNAAQLTNGENGTLEINNNAILSYIEPLGGSIRNDGTVIKNASDATSVIEVDFFNGGLLDVQAGQIQFLRFLANERFATLSGSGTLDVSQALFLNDGIVNPGSSPGILTITGDYPQSGSARLNVELGGATPGSGFDQLNISGTAQLDGTLNIALADGFVPQANHSFEIITANSRIGEFNQILGLNSDVYDIVYNPGSVVLTNFNFPPNQPPSANNDVILTSEDNVAIMLILNNDSDPDGNSLSINSFTQPQHGEAVQSSSDRLIYTPDDNFFGLDTLFYVVSDGFGGTDQARVIINVISVNDLPEIFPPLPDVSFLSNDSTTLDLNQFAIDLESDASEMSWSAEVLSAENGKQVEQKANDFRTTSTSSQKDGMERTLVDPADLQISINAQSNLATFTASSDSFGVFSVKFTVTDGGGGSARDTISVSVRSAPPVVDNPIENQVFAEDSGPHIISDNLFDVFRDPENATALTFSASSDNPKILPLISGDSLLLTTELNYFGSGIITVNAVDPSGASGSDIFNVEFTPVNDTPLFESLPDSLWFWKDSLLTINIWDYVSDAETADEELAYEFTADNDSLERDFDAETGELTLTSNNGFYGKVLMGVQATDPESAAASDTIEVFVTFTSAIDDPVSNTIPMAFSLEQNFPNPFNPETNIRFHVPAVSDIKLNIYNILGQRVRTLVDRKFTPGIYQAAWDGRNEHGVQMASGVYIYQVSAKSTAGKVRNFHQVRKMILLR